MSSQGKKDFRGETRKRSKKGIKTATKEEKSSGHVYLVRTNGYMEQ